MSKNGKEDKKRAVFVGNIDDFLTLDAFKIMIGTVCPHVPVNIKFSMGRPYAIVVMADHHQAVSLLEAIPKLPIQKGNQKFITAVWAIGNTKKTEKNVRNAQLSRYDDPGNSQSCGVYVGDVPLGSKCFPELVKLAGVQRTVVSLVYEKNMRHAIVVLRDHAEAVKLFRYINETLDTEKYGNLYAEWPIKKTKDPVSKEDQGPMPAWKNGKSVAIVSSTNIPVESSSKESASPVLAPIPEKQPEKNTDSVVHQYCFDGVTCTPFYPVPGKIMLHAYAHTMDADPDAKGFKVSVLLDAAELREAVDRLNKK